MNRIVSIALLGLLLLGGCSSTKMAYRYADWGIVWWVDDYIPMTAEQESRLEQDIHDICIDEGLGVVTYFSLASGFLTGKYQKKEDAKGRNREDFVKKYFDDKGMAILNALEQVSKKHEVSQAAVSLAWLMNSKGVTAPIASATKKKQLTAFIEAANLQLTPEDMEILDNPVKMSV